MVHRNKEIPVHIKPASQHKTFKVASQHKPYKVEK